MNAIKEYLQNIPPTCWFCKNLVYVVETSREYLQICKNTKIKILLKLNQNQSKYEFQDSLRSQFTNSAVNDSSWYLYYIL